jgi:RHS repeat-associated protein
LRTNFRVTGNPAAGSDAFGWDANGRQITRTFGADTATYSFDPLDRLTQVVSGTTTVQLAYNGDGVRMGKTVNAAGTAYVQDVQAGLPVVLAETTGGQTSLYVYGNDLLARVDAAGTPAFYHADGLGSVRGLSDLAGALTDAYTYDAFGALRSQTGGAGPPFTFTGEQADGEVGLVFLRARYYEPTVGRFVSRDAHPALARETQTINRYAYVQNNAVRFTDPSGNAWYDILNAEKNGLNQAIRDLWNKSGVGDFIVQNTPFLKGMVDTAEGMDQYARERRRSLELITPDMTDADAREFEEAEQSAMQGLQKGLSGANDALMKAPCTSLNPDCGLTSFLPKPISSLYNFVRSPFVWLLNQGKDAVTDPIYDIPSLYIQHQFRNYHGNSPQSGQVSGVWSAQGGGSGGYGAPPSKGK